MINVAIDGPAGAGKSTIARRAAEKLGYIYVDTGALYRAVGLKFSKTGADISSDEEIERVLSETAVDIRFSGGEQHVFLDGEDVSGLIRTPEASMMASAVSAKPAVRAFLLEMQRQLARENNVIMDGRDIGTCVLPGAQLKIYLTASVHTRAQRRYKELTEKGTACSLEEIEKDIEERDYRDMHREISPLKAAPDAVVLDTSHMDIPQVIEKIMELAKKAGIAGKGL